MIDVGSWERDQTIPGKPYGKSNRTAFIRIVNTRRTKPLSHNVQEELELFVKIVIITGHLLDHDKHLLRCEVKAFSTEGGLTGKKDPSRGVDKGPALVLLYRQDANYFWLVEIDNKPRERCAKPSKLSKNSHWLAPETCAMLYCKITFDIRSKEYWIVSLILISSERWAWQTQYGMVTTLIGKQIFSLLLIQLLELFSFDSNSRSLLSEWAR